MVNLAFSFDLDFDMQKLWMFDRYFILKFKFRVFWVYQYYLAMLGIGSEPQLTAQLIKASRVINQGDGLQRCSPEWRMNWQGLHGMKGKKIGPWKIQGKVIWVACGFKGGRSSWVEVWRQFESQYGSSQAKGSWLSHSPDLWTLWFLSPTLSMAEQLVLCYNLSLVGWGCRRLQKYSQTHISPTLSLQSRMFLRRLRSTAENHWLLSHWSRNQELHNGENLGSV